VPLLAAAERHADAALPHVIGSDYMVEHWLAAYATLLLSSQASYRSWNSRLNPEGIL
jgi:hypothetical protein